MIPDIKEYMDKVTVQSPFAKPLLRYFLSLNSYIFLIIRTESEKYNDRIGVRR